MGKGERAWARIFKLLRHQFYGIVTLVSETLYLLYTLPLCLQNCRLSKKQGSPKWRFLCFFKVWKFGLWRATSARCVCYVTLSLTPSGLNFCQIVNTILYIYILLYFIYIRLYIYNTRRDQEWHSTSIIYIKLYVCSVVKINKKEWQHATKPLEPLNFYSEHLLQYRALIVNVKLYC
jgi:hypothetical protein